MLGRAKKMTRFEDSDSHMSRPRAVPEASHRPAPRVPLRLRTAAPAPVPAGSETSGGAHRAAGAGRGTSPRSPLHEKRPVGADGGGRAGTTTATATTRVAELEAKLAKAQDQLTGMRVQLAAAEKARKDARAALLDAKKRFGAVKNGGNAAATSALAGDVANAPAEQKRQAEVVTVDAAANGGGDERSSAGSPSPLITDVPEEAKKMIGDNDDDDDEVSSIAVVADGDGKKGNPEADELRQKLMAKDAEAYELRARLLVKDMETDEMRKKLAAKGAEADELREKLAAKAAEAAALEADNADLMRMAEETSDAARETAGKARELEHALRESAAREARLAERLRASERAREAMQAEVQRSRVQSEQWRKAAEEAAVVLGEVDGRHAGVRGTEAADKNKRPHTSERTPSKDEADDEGGSGGKRKAGAMRMLSDLWKKGQKQ